MGAGKPRTVALLREHSGARTRTVDDHMFGVGRSSFRVQLFTAPGLRPVAIATQAHREGASLTNRAERFVEAVWERLCPGEAEPPIFIAHQLFDRRDFGFVHYGFTVTGPYTVASPPKWGPRLSDGELQELVGGPVDPTRGSGFVAPEPPDEPQMRYAVATVLGLPRPDLDGEPSCMPVGTPWWRRLARQVVARRAGRGCCSYHAADWAAASRAAISALSQADAGPIDRDADADVEDERMDAALKALRAQRLDEKTLKAAESLFLDPIQPECEDGAVWYINGRHRAQAMLDGGVRRTVVGRWTDPDGDR